MPVLPDVISLESASLESSNVLASDTAFTSDATPSSESCTTIDSFCEDETVVSLPLPISSHHVTRCFEETIRRPPFSTYVPFTED